VPQPDDPTRIVNISSLNGTDVAHMESYAYPASKAALNALTRQLAWRSNRVIRREILMLYHHYRRSPRDNPRERGPMNVPSLDEYSQRYEHIHFKREDGILEVRLHSDGGEIIWDYLAHTECSYVFEDINRDPENKVVILTGSGGAFIREEQIAGFQVTPEVWASVLVDARRLLTSLLDVQAPMIAAINGPATIHADLALLCDITIAAEHTVFADAPHALNGLVPGDGVHVVWPLLLGPNRARYFLLTGQEIGAQDAKTLGVVNEVLPADEVLPRAWECARMLRSRPEAATRLTRSAMVHSIKKLMEDSLDYGLALEGLAAISHWP